MRHRIPVACALLLSIGLTDASAQSLQKPQLINMPDGRSVEIIGLRRWTVQMIQDSLDRYSPGTKLTSHGCAAILRYTLKFADASAVTITGYQPTGDRTVLTLREPQDSARVRYRDMALDTVGGSAELAELRALLRRNPQLTSILPTVVRYNVNVGNSDYAKYKPIIDSAFTFIRARNTERDRLAATRILTEGKVVADRAAAALVMLNFGSRDDTYWTLVEAMRETDGFAKGAAGAVLRALVAREPRSVNWTPVVPAIHAMLDGTSLFEVTTLIEILVESGVGPEHARPFLRGGGEILLGYLMSDTRMYSAPTRSLLVKLRGQDLGNDASAWAAWMATL